MSRKILIDQRAERCSCNWSVEDTARLDNVSVNGDKALFAQLAAMLPSDLQVYHVANLHDNGEFNVLYTPGCQAMIIARPGELIIAKEIQSMAIGLDLFVLNRDAFDEHVEVADTFEEDEE